VHAKLYVDPPHLDASDVLDANIRCLIKFDARTSRWTINNTIHALLSKSLSGAAQPGKPCTASDMRCGCQRKQASVVHGLWLLTVVPALILARFV
jgi:hypothetical protein